MRLVLIGILILLLRLLWLAGSDAAVLAAMERSQSRFPEIAMPQDGLWRHQQQMKE